MSEISNLLLIAWEEAGMRERGKERERVRDEEGKVFALVHDLVDWNIKTFLIE